MKKGMISSLGVFGFLISFALVSAGGDVEEGKKLFHDPSLGGSKNSRSCGSCHPDGSGLEDAGSKANFPSFGTKDVKDVVNACIRGPLKGTPLSKDSEGMGHIISYIKSLGKH
jgi:cytochrome c